MKQINWIPMLAAAAGLAIAQQSGAHHSFAAVFDATKPVTIEGTVVKFDFINPHGWVHLDVAPPEGAVQRWRVEVANPNALLRLGWRKDSLKPGDRVTITGFKARDGSNTAIGREFKLGDGRTVLGNVAQEDAP